MSLGAFSVSLSVKNLPASESFYAKLGFSQIAGNPTDGWLVMTNGDCTIGLFQGMFEKNMLTFNPGWDQTGNPLASFEDVRAIQKKLRSAGIAIVEPADESTSGPASFTVIDPDGNPILFDQHV